MDLIISSTGELRCVYSEALDLSALGRLSIQRASHVEPDTVGQWWADLRPVAGPVIGPFSLRSQALEAETTWLRNHWLLRASEP